MTMVAAASNPPGMAVVRRGWLPVVELPIVLLLVTLVAMWALRTQRYEVLRYWDSDEYFLMATQFASGETITASAPYAYRLFVPWMVARVLPGDVQSGFLFVNLAAGAVMAVLLVFWLRRFVTITGIRLLMLFAYVLQWHGPIRFVFYYPAYVDPVFQALLVAALLVGDRLLANPSAVAGLGFAVVTVLGTLTREAFVLAPAACLVGAIASRRGHGVARVVWPIVALVAAAAVFAGARMATDPRPGYSFLGAIGSQLVNKPPESMLLVWFIAFGPMIAVVLYDWRATARFLRMRPDLTACLAGCVALAYVGGQDTERILFWAMPVVYLLVAQSMERHRRVLTSVALVVLLAAGQMLSQRVLWPVPTPITAVTPWATDLNWAQRAYAVVNRMFVIDDFHWNLWSNFGSRPSHLLQLGFYLLLSAAILGLMHRRDARLAGAAA